MEINDDSIINSELPRNASNRLFVTLTKWSHDSTYSSKLLTSGGKDDMRGIILSIGKKTERVNRQIFSLIIRKA